MTKYLAASVALAMSAAAAHATFIDAKTLADLVAGGSLAAGELSIEQWIDATSLDPPRAQKPGSDGFAKSRQFGQHYAQHLAGLAKTPGYGLGFYLSKGNGHASQAGPSPKLKSWSFRSSGKFGGLVTSVYSGTEDAVPSKPLRPISELVGRTLPDPDPEPVQLVSAKEVSTPPSSQAARSNPDRNATSVPESSSTLILLGCLLVGIEGLRRGLSR